jgi:hypothetical protein
MRTSGRSERPVGNARSLGLSRADRQRIFRVQLTLRLGGLLLLAATSPAIELIRMDVAIVRIALFAIVYLGVEALLMRKTSRIIAEIRERDADLVRPPSVDPPFRVAGAGELVEGSRRLSAKGGCTDREEEDGALTDRGVRPDAATVAANDALDGRESDSRAGKFAVRV